MKFTLKDAHKFGWKGLEAWAFNSKGDFENASAAYFKVDGSHGKVKTTSSDRVYYVLEGTGEFVIDGQSTQVEKTDVFIVPKNTAYDYKGKMSLFLVHTPAFDQDAEIKLE